MAITIYYDACCVIHLITCLHLQLMFYGSLHYFLSHFKWIWGKSSILCSLFCILIGTDVFFFLKIHIWLWTIKELKLGSVSVKVRFGFCFCVWGISYFVGIKQKLHF